MRKLLAAREPVPSAGQGLRDALDDADADEVLKLIDSTLTRGRRSR